MKDNPSPSSGHSPVARYGGSAPTLGHPLCGRATPVARDRQGHQTASGPTIAPSFPRCAVTNRLAFQASITRIKRHEFTDGRNR